MQGSAAQTVRAEEVRGTEWIPAWQLGVLGGILRLESQRGRV